MARRRELDPGVAQILREEAERETAARRGFQPSEDEDDPVPVPPASQPPPRAEPEYRSEPTPVTTHPDSGRDLLPNIDEINSSLRSSSDRPPPPEDLPSPAESAEVAWRRGFRLGFGTVLLIAVILALVYAQAPRIAEAVPSLAPALETYVAQVDTARFWLDLRLQDMLERVAGA